MKTLLVSVGDGATQSSGPADMMGETGRTPALGLVTWAPLGFTLKLYPNTCCHGDALDCKHLSGPQGLKNCPRMHHRWHQVHTHTRGWTCYRLATNAHQHYTLQVTHTHKQAALDAYTNINTYLFTHYLMPLSPLSINLMAIYRVGHVSDYRMPCLLFRESHHGSHREVF